MDNIRDEIPASETSDPRSGDPESQTRGGPEAPGATLDDTRPRNRGARHQDPPASFFPPDGMPGMRAGLPPGSLPGPYLGPQGDEDRTPPANAPSPVMPAVTVADSARDRGPA